MGSQLGSPVFLGPPVSDDLQNFFFFDGIGLLEAEEMALVHDCGNTYGSTDKIMENLRIQHHNLHEKEKAGTRKPQFRKSTFIRGPAMGPQSPSIAVRCRTFASQWHAAVLLLSCSRIVAGKSGDVATALDACLRLSLR